MNISTSWFFFLFFPLTGEPFELMSRCILVACSKNLASSITPLLTHIQYPRDWYELWNIFCDVLIQAKWVWYWVLGRSHFKSLVECNDHLLYYHILKAVPALISTHLSYFWVTNNTMIKVAILPNYHWV